MTQSRAGRPGRPPVDTDEPVVLSAIRRAAAAWLSGEAVAEEAGLPLERVRAVLETSPVVLVEPSADGSPRYSTRDHYRATAGLVRRYLDALLTS